MRLHATRWPKPVTGRLNAHGYCSGKLAVAAGTIIAALAVAVVVANDRCGLR